MTLVGAVRAWCIGAYLIFAATGPRSTDSYNAPSTPSRAQSHDAVPAAKSVRFKVSVTDDKGRPILALRKEQFFVTVGKTQETIDYFSQADAPASICVVYDSSGSMRTHRPELVNLPEHLLQMARASNPGSEFCIVAFSDQAEIVMDWQKDREEIATGINRLGELEPHGPTALFDAVALAVRITKDRPTDRHIVLVLTDGLDDKSKASSLECGKLIQDSDVLVYSIATISTQDDSLDQMAASRLKRMSEISGGQIFFTAEGAQTHADIQTITSQIRRLYTVGFINTGTDAAPRFRALKVKLVSGASTHGSRSHITLRYRETF
ncbi:MAG TPA: VWA domain-containing protein [Blastocatellia bacterium]